MSIFDEEDITEKDKVQMPSCLSLFNQWRICSSSQMQIHNYYIHGNFSKCTEEQSNWTNCLAWKTKKSKEARDSILMSVKQKEEEKKKKHTACIWKFRREPGKDWNAS
eukprot:Seg3060.2 transcript_id=Seg3060.2/GoldUCD/mRNA.D3Y31 product="UPF0545 protein C22orf39-like" protein_id=Seg3060.2/GoldUCD/D3Y31